MNQYLKYILLIILGIILFTLLNNKENFSIGNQVIMRLNDFIKEDISEVIRSGCVLCTFDRIFRFPVIENTPKKALEKLKRAYSNWILFLKGTVLLVSGVIVILAFMALFLF